MSENQRFSYFFQGYRNLTLGYNGLKLVRVKATQKKKKHLGIILPGLRLRIELVVSSYGVMRKL